MVQKTPTCVSDGYIAVSTSALAQLGLGEGDHLFELVVDGVLVYVPVAADVTDAHDRFVQALQARGVTAEDLLADIDEHKDEVCEALYGAPSK